MRKFQMNKIEWLAGDVMMKIHSSCFILPLLGFYRLLLPTTLSEHLAGIPFVLLFKQVYFYWL